MTISVMSAGTRLKTRADVLVQGDFDLFKAHDEIVTICNRDREDVSVRGAFDQFTAYTINHDQL